MTADRMPDCGPGLLRMHGKRTQMADASTGNVADLVTEAAASVPEHLALLDHPAGGSLNWRVTEEAVRTFATRLLSVGLEAGDRVAVSLPGGVHLCVAIVGVLRAGGVLAPMSPELPEPEVRRVLDDSGARFLVGGSADLGVPTV